MKFFTFTGIVGLLLWVGINIYLYNDNAHIDNNLVTSLGLTSWIVTAVSFAILGFIIKWRWADWQVQRRRRGLDKKSDYAKALLGGALMIPPKNNGKKDM